MTPDPPPLTLDHVLIAVRDLDVAAESYRRLLGRGHSWRGSHPSYGTANVLFKLDNTYLELLAPGEEARQDSPWRKALQDKLDATGEGLYAIALGTPDVDATVAAMRQRGLDVQDPADGDGVDLDTGARRAWRNARMPVAATRGLRAFFIEHTSPPDALPEAKPTADVGSVVTAVDHTVVASSDLPAAVTLWRDVMGLDLRLTLDRPGGRQLNFFRLGESILEVVGVVPNQSEPAMATERTPARGGSAMSGSDQPPATSDLLWGLAYRVPDIAATVERLRALDVVVSDTREGNAPGTVVADLKLGFSHDVRTLFIQKDVPA